MPEHSQIPVSNYSFRQDLRNQNKIDESGYKYGINRNFAQKNASPSCGCCGNSSEEKEDRRDN